MYSTVSMGPLFKESVTEFSQTPTPLPPPTHINTPPPSNGVSPHFTVEPLPSDSLPIIPSFQPSKKLPSIFITSTSGKRSRTAALKVQLVNFYTTDVNATW